MTVKELVSQVTGGGNPKAPSGRRPSPRTVKGLVSGLSDGTGVRGRSGHPVSPPLSIRTPKTRYIRPPFTPDVTGFAPPTAPHADTSYDTNPSTRASADPSSAGSNLPDKLGTS